MTAGVRCELYPAIDVRAGRVVRLTQGDYDRETTYGDDPVAVARSFAQAGATWIHVVDLDAARSGDPVNRPVVAAITAAVAGMAQVQTGGGVRTLDDVKALTEAGVARVVMGSAAVAHPPLVAQAAALTAVAVGLDHRSGHLAVHGWTDTSDVTLDEAMGWFTDTASAYIITDIGRDGMLSGPDLEGLSRAASATSVPVIASGGVATLHDIATLAGVSGIAGVITGRALYEGRFDVTAALAAVRGAS